MNRLTGWYIVGNFFRLLLLCGVMALIMDAYEDRETDPAWGQRVGYLSLILLVIVLEWARQ